MDGRRESGWKDKGRVDGRTEMRRESAWTDAGRSDGRSELKNVKSLIYGCLHRHSTSSFDFGFLNCQIPMLVVLTFNFMIRIHTVGFVWTEVVSPHLFIIQLKL